MVPLLFSPLSCSNNPFIYAVEILEEFELADPLLCLPGIMKKNICFEFYVSSFLTINFP